MPLEGNLLVLAETKERLIGWGRSRSCSAKIKTKEEAKRKEERSKEMLRVCGEGGIRRPKTRRSNKRRKDKEKANQGATNLNKKTKKHSSIKQETEENTTRKKTKKKKKKKKKKNKRWTAISAPTRIVFAGRNDGPPGPRKKRESTQKEEGGSSGEKVFIQARPNLKEKGTYFGLPGGKRQVEEGKGEMGKQSKTVPLSWKKKMRTGSGETGRNLFARGD